MKYRAIYLSEVPISLLGEISWMRPKYMHFGTVMICMKQKWLFFIPFNLFCIGFNNYLGAVHLVSVKLSYVIFSLFTEGSC